MASLVPDNQASQAAADQDDRLPESDPGSDTQSVHGMAEDELADADQKQSLSGRPSKASSHRQLKQKRLGQAQRKHHSALDRAPKKKAKRPKRPKKTLSIYEDSRRGQFACAHVFAHAARFMCRRALDAEPLLTALCAAGLSRLWS